MNLWQAMCKHSPFRAVYVENNESIGAWTPWGAIKEAKDWQREKERDWETSCGRFLATAFGYIIFSTPLDEGEE